MMTIGGARNEPGRRCGTTRLPRSVYVNRGNKFVVLSCVCCLLDVYYNTLLHTGRTTRARTRSTYNGTYGVRALGSPVLHQIDRQLSRMRTSY